MCVFTLCCLYFVFYLLQFVLRFDNNFFMSLFIKDFPISFLIHEKSGLCLLKALTSFFPLSDRLIYRKYFFMI